MCKSASAGTPVKESTAKGCISQKLPYHLRQFPHGFRSMGGGAPLGALAFSGVRESNNSETEGLVLRTAVYIDGFNLYYWLKPLAYRWIDLKALALAAVAKPGMTYEVVAVKYYTARVSDTRADPTKATRQDTYIQALRATIPELTVCYGEFRRKKKWMPRVLDGDRIGAQVQVWDTEEKGSDVNLAVDLLNDGWGNKYDLALVVSNDSDLERAVLTVKKKGFRVGVLVRGDAQVVSLRKASTFYVPLTVAHLQAALMPHTIPGTAIQIPGDWREKERLSGIR